MKGKKQKPAKPVANIHWIRDAASDFRLGSAMLEKHFGGTLFPLRATVVTHIFAIELYLKYLRAKEAGQPDADHDLLSLYEALSQSTRDTIVNEYRGNRTIDEVLRENRSAFVEWRYLYEQQAGSFCLDFQALSAVAAALAAVANR